MKCYVIQHNGDTPGQVVEVHLVLEDAIKKVKALNKLSTITYWYRECPLMHRLLISTSKGVAEMAVATPIGDSPLSAIGALGG